ncbi:MAG: hypothetical protein JSW11_07055 [Candidatus Heimdallarchaeota archaeon]|nr:MAG: hypothetical protein JSW11_07055 [Candidatus Heimdallarchaeota archaeon]
MAEEFEDTEFDFKDMTCGQCAYLTDKASIKGYAEITEKEAGLCRLLVLHNNFAIMLRDEIACPDFIPRE